jgi:hypothetical protein
LANDQSAEQLAREVAKNHPQSFENATVYLGLLRSKDLRTLPQPRRSAVNAFWSQYFKENGAESVVSAIDGSGRLSRFLKEQRRKVTDRANGEATLAIVRK